MRVAVHTAVKDDRDTVALVAQDPAMEIAHKLRFVVGIAQVNSLAATDQVVPVNDVVHSLYQKEESYRPRSSSV